MWGRGNNVNFPSLPFRVQREPEEVYFIFDGFSVARTTATRCTAVRHFRSVFTSDDKVYLINTKLSQKDRKLKVILSNRHLLSILKIVFNNRGIDVARICRLYNRIYL